MRIGIVGASSLVGKELAEELGASALAAADVTLLDEEEIGGQMTTVGDEAAVIRLTEASSFDRMDLCFFTGRAEETLRFWQAARRAGVGVVDLTLALGDEPGVLVRAPWVTGAVGPRRGVGEMLHLATPAVIPAHPVAVILGLVAVRCTGLGLRSLAATVLEPASERGHEGMAEMHQQTVNLLSFQSLPREVFDAQVAFNLTPALGPGAKVRMEETAQRIRADYAGAVGGEMATLALQMLHAPVFHGYGLSVLLEFSRDVRVGEVEAALAGGHVEVVSEDGDPPSNLSAAGQGTVLAKVSGDSGRRVWLWLAADNLKMRALHAIACAGELEALRPQGTVQ